MFKKNDPFKYGYVLLCGRFVNFGIFEQNNLRISFFFFFFFFFWPKHA